MNKIAEFLAIGLPLMLAATLATAQVPVDDDGNPIGAYQPATPQTATGAEGIPLLSHNELQELVGPVALYPDDLLAIVLPAAAYPLQIVQAARFLEDLETDPSLKPDPDWDDSVIALINYPEVIELLNEDLDWTWQLGEAVVAQQADVVAAIETFRNRAYAAGNLHSDSYQDVEYEDGVIEITPVNDDIIYVPYYEPETVVIRQPSRVYYYYPDPCPVYYYPYPDSYAFRRGYFWGVTTAFTIGWTTNRLRVYHPSYVGHPYYGRHYWNRWYYRRPSITVYNNIYINNRRDLAARRYTHGDYWRPSRHTRLRYSDQRITRTRAYGDRNRNYSDRYRTTTRRTVVADNRRNTVRRQTTARRDTVRHQATVRRDSRPSTTRRSSQRTYTERRAPAERQTSQRVRPAQQNRSSAERRQARQQSRRVEPDRQARARDRQPPQRQSRQRPETKESRRNSERRSEDSRSQRTRETRTREARTRHR